MKILKIFLKSLQVILVTCMAIIITLFLSLKLITSDISPSARNLFVTTFLETGQMKFLPSLFLSQDKINQILENNKISDFDLEVDLNLIEISKDHLDTIELIPIAGKSFAAKMLIIHDPSRIKLTSIPEWTTYGLELHKLVEQENALGGFNSGMYYSHGNEGGSPEGVVVEDGKITYNVPQKGIHLIGFNYDNLLRVISLDGKNKQQIEKIVKEENIRDAVTFLEGTSDSNHFVKLITNGVERKVEGRGSGANPRTAIGQRKDGAILVLVTDGRGKDGHLGATAKDLIAIMKEHGAINAANLDGGSSSSMYYEGIYEMPSVTLYYSNSSWRLPTAWVIEKR